MSQKTALERIEDLEKRLQQNEANTHGSFRLAEGGLQKLMALEQSYAALAKTVYGLISSLRNKGLVDDNSVMSAIRELDETNDKGDVQALLESGAIRPTDAVLDNGLVVVSNLLFEGDGATPVSTSNYRVINLGVDGVPAKLKEQLVGKKSGDSFEMPIGGGKISYTVLEAYELVELENKEYNEKEGS